MKQRNIINKKGEYILETAISLPFFIIAVIIMCSIILMYAVIEDSNFIMATELRRASAESIMKYDSKGFITNTRNRIEKNHSQVSGTTLCDCGYRVDRWGLDELIFLDIEVKMEVDNPINVASNSSAHISSVTRAYVGKERDMDNMSAAEMMNKADAVYIFPKRGEKYHAKNCAVLKAASKSDALTTALKRNYSPCPVCHSRKALMGDLVYYFPNDGESFHMPSCVCLQRNYIEVEKIVAEKRGYTVCSKCGG